MAAKTWKATTRERIHSGTLAESIIRKARVILAQAINADEYHGREEYRPHGLRASDARDLVQLIRDARPLVTDAQARKGAEWLRGIVWTPRGADRATENARKFNAADREVLRGCLVSPRFHLVDMEEHYSGRYLESLAPVYRCCDGRGASFDYCASSWQSGGGLYITRHADRS